MGRPAVCFVCERGRLGESGFFFSFDFISSVFFLFCLAVWFASENETSGLAQWPVLFPAKAALRCASKRCDEVI
jgi:hypothetical protein